MTRRFFTGLIGAAGGAVSSARDFAGHRILRRPYRKIATVAARPYMLWDAVRLSVEFPGIRDPYGQFPVRLTVAQQGSPEMALQATVMPRSGESFFLLGVHGMRAETAATITIEAKRKFELVDLRVSFMRPSFRRIDGMIVYADPFYKSHPETDDFGQAMAPHHRKIYGPGKDVGY